jgi:hypothetical protein
MADINSEQVAGLRRNLQIQQLKQKEPDHDDENTGD